MKYRKFKKTGEKISNLGFGTMRLPVINGDENNINEEEAIKMIRFAIDNGVNYVDTAYMYHGGNSETVVGKALKDGYREKVFLADKIPVWLAKDELGIEKMFNEQFERLDTDCIDMYLIHNVTGSVWRKCKKYNILEFLKRKQAEGKIKHIGFSFHDEYSLFEEVLHAFPWDFCQIQLNYMDAEFQAGVKGLKLAGAKGIPVVVMEPLKGGKLTDALPPSIQKYWSETPVTRTPAEWAFKWVADFPEVLTILSGMSTIEQLQENVNVLSKIEACTLTEDEHEIIRKVSHEYNRLIKYSCTDCKYCMPCPNKINIPTIINFCNEWSLYEGSARTKADYYTWTQKGSRASDCTACKECESKCPQGLPISNIMKNAAVFFE